MAADLEMDSCGALEESRPARTVHPRRHSHCRWREGHQRARLGAYGPWFEEPRPPGDSGSEGEPAKADTVAGGHVRGGGRHGRRPGAIGRMRNGSRSHETRNKLHGEREGRTAKLTAGKNNVDGGLEMADHTEADGGSRRTLRRLLWLPRRLANMKKRAGRQQGCARGFSTL